jgi:hypothetical protein
LGLDVDLDLDYVRGTVAPAPQNANIKTAPDLEGALKSHGTKVIRLADPAHIPVDKGPPVSQSGSPHPLVPQTQRKTPSPDLSVANLSVISHSKVGIAISTPPEEAERIVAGPLPISASYVPSHPYAQGGLSFSVQTSSSGREHPIASPTPEAHSPPLSEVLARQTVSPHPYALASEENIQPTFRLGINVGRDSYLDANGLIGQFRSDDRHPDPSRMWAQLSPDAVREILPDDIQYSPYDFSVTGIEKLEGTRRIPGLHKEGTRMRSIHDTAGVAKALLSTTRYGEDMKMEEGKDDGRIVTRLENPEKMQPSSLVMSSDLRKASHTSSAHTIASSHLDSLKSPSTSIDYLETASSVPTLGSPLPAFRPLGSPNDLEAYQDLFYQPSPTDGQYSTALPDGAANAVSWDAAVRNRHTGSSLTSLARQLGEKCEAFASAHTSRASSVYLNPRNRALCAQPHHSGLPTDGNLQFVLEEMASAEFPDKMPDAHESLRTFDSANLPEDVDSIQTSSIMDGNGDEDDPTGWYSRLHPPPQMT